MSIASISNFGWFESSGLGSISVFGWFIDGGIPGVVPKGIFVGMDGIFDEGIWY